MRGAIIHGVLLAVMLVYGYRTWTRDTTEEANVGSVVLWDRSESDLVSIEYKAPKKIVKLERKADYWWGVDTTIETKPKTPPTPPPAAGSNALALPPPIEEIEVGRKTHEFPLGEAADKLVKGYGDARALRDLNKPNDETKKTYKLNDSKTTLTINFKDGSRTFLVGGTVYGANDRYILDQQSGKAYVLSRDLITALEMGESSLHLTDPRGFDVAKIDTVTIDAGGKSKTAARVTTGVEGQQVKTWGDPDTKKANQTLANFIDNSNNLRPTEYASSTKVSDLTPVLKLTYKDERGQQLGTLALYKHEKPGVLPEGQELDPANPPPGEIEYFIMTEKTRVPALVRKDTAQRAEQDIETVFSGKPQPETGNGSGSVEPHGNPFGNPHGMPPNPHAGGLQQEPHLNTPGAPGMGSAATPKPPTPGAGSAAAMPKPGAAVGSAAPTSKAAPAPAAGSAAPTPKAAPTAPAAGSAAPTPKAPAAGNAAPTPKAAPTAPAAGSAAPH